MRKGYLTVADISKLQERFKSQHDMLGKDVARLEQQSKELAQAIAQVQTNAVAEQFKQALIDVERSFSIPSVGERLSPTALQLPDFARTQRELAASRHLSQEVRDTIENLGLSNRTVIDEFAAQTIRARQEIETIVAKSSSNTVIEQLEAERALFERITTQVRQPKMPSFDVTAIERLRPPCIDIKPPSLDFSGAERLQQLHADFKKSLLVASAFNSVTQTAAEHFAAEMKQLGITSPLPGLLEISPDGVVTLGGESATAQEVNEAVEGLCSLIDEPDFFDSLWERLKEFKVPIQAVVLWVFNKILLVICLSVMSNLLTPYIQLYLDQFSFKSRREVTQAIKRLPCEVNINDLTTCRVVTGDYLRLRAKPSMKARVLDELRRGKLVRVIEKRRNWTRVEVQYEDSDEPLQGWVATRYIAALRR